MSGNHFVSKKTILKNLVPDSHIATMEKGSLPNFSGQCWGISRGLFGYEAKLAADPSKTWVLEGPCN